MQKIKVLKTIKGLLFTIIISLSFVLIAKGSVDAITSENISFQGKIVRNDTGNEGLNVVNGSPVCVVDGIDTCDFEIAYYTASSAGTLLFTEKFNNIEIGSYGGVFDLTLGTGTPTSGLYSSMSQVFANSTEVYIELRFAPDGTTITETFERTPVRATAYSLKSKYSKENIGGFTFNGQSAAPSSPTAGTLYYDTDTATLNLYSGGAWNSLATGGASLWSTNTLSGLTWDQFMIDASPAIASLQPFSGDATEGRVSINGSTSKSGLSVYSTYNTGTDWPLASFKADGSSFSGTILQLLQDGVGKLMSGYKGSNLAFEFDNDGGLHLASDGITYIEGWGTAPTVSNLNPNNDGVDNESCVYSYSGNLYWDALCDGTIREQLNSGVVAASLWTDGGTFSYLTSTTDDLVLGASTLAGATFVFDVDGSSGNYFEIDSADNSKTLLSVDDNGNVGIGTSNPLHSLDIAGSDNVISNQSGDLTINPAGNLIISNANVGVGTLTPGSGATSPGVNLDVSGTIIANYIKMGSNSNDNYSLSWDTSEYAVSDYTFGARLYGWGDNTQDGLLIDAGGFYARKGIYGPNNFGVDSSGNLGIGISSNIPSALLHVQKALTSDPDVATYFLANRNDSTDREYRLIGRRTGGTYEYYTTFNLDRAADGTWTQGSWGGSSAIIHGGGGTLNFLVYPSDVGGSNSVITPTTAMAIASNGNITLNGGELTIKETGDYAEIIGYMDGSTNLVKFSTGLYVSSGNTFTNSDLYLRGLVRNDSANYNGRVYVSDDLQATGNLYVNGTIYDDNDGDVNIGESLDVNGTGYFTSSLSATTITNRSFDFILGNGDQVTRGDTGSSLALVKAYGGVLAVNYANNFYGGTRIMSTLDIDGDVLLDGVLTRSSHSSGYFVGGYNNIGASESKSSPIYTIGSGYKPTDTTLGNMYGIGYTHDNFWYNTLGYGREDGWGLYVAAGGGIRATISGSNGNIWSAGSIYVNGSIYDGNDGDVNIGESLYVSGNGTMTGDGYINSQLKVGSSTSLTSYDTILVGNRPGANGLYNDGYAKIRLGPNSNAGRGWSIMTYDPGNANRRFYIYDQSNGAERFTIFDQGHARFAGEVQTQQTIWGRGQYRFVHGNYGLVNYNDGAGYYMLLTNSGDPYGAWNSKRPFKVRVATGYVDLDAGHGDMAEKFNLKGDADRGMILSVDSSTEKNVVKAVKGDVVIGAISTDPGAVMSLDGNFQVGFTTKAKYSNEETVVALTGTVPVIVSTENGQIKSGDPIAVGNIPGVGAKAIVSSNIVGKALESTMSWQSSSCTVVSSYAQIVWPEDNGKNELKPCFKLPNGTYIGKILVVVHASWYSPSIEQAMETGEFVYDSNENLKLIYSRGSEISNVGSYSTLNVLNLGVGSVNTESLMIKDEDLLGKIENIELTLTQQLEALQADIEILKTKPMVVSRTENIEDPLSGYTISMNEGIFEVGGDMNVLGVSTFNGDVNVGDIEVSNNGISVGNNSCVTSEGILDLEVCASNTLFVQRGLTGYVNFFNGNIILTPEGDIISKGSKVQAAQLLVNVDPNSIKEGVITAGTDNVVIENLDISVDSKILLTPRNNTHGKVLFVSERVEGTSFTVSISSPIDQDITFDWFILESIPKAQEDI